ncbi:MAG: sodium-translocating pyrophosphatase, partial [Candidatus Omnitrophica bacterium]|nr:sodium-translocating pyrophosphatase [Candidatus Omnitrophota bacterium]
MHLDLLILAPIGSILALSFAGYLVMKILKTSEGTSEMIAIAEAVREGSYAYLKRQYSGVAIFFGAMFLVLIGLALAGKLPIFVPFAFLTGGFFSGLAGFIGMSIATRSSARTTNAAKSSLNAGLNIAFSSGAVMGLVVVGLGLLDLSIWYYFLDWWYSSHATPLGMDKLGAITSTMLCFGMGASSQALFARVGGGIFTKAADVGADLVGKVEAGIPEDDPRNPAVIADNVGDNVGDVAGMGADLYESYVGSIVATAALGVAAFGRLGLGLQSVTIPMVMAAVGVMASIIGTFFVKTKEKACQGTLLTALRRGVFSSSIIVAIVSFFVVKYILGMQYIGVYWAVLSGLVAGVLIGLSTEYFTSSKYKPTQAVAASSLTGPATVIISGMSVGMLSTAVPVLVVSAAIMASYYFAGGAANAALGLYGVAISAVGMLSTLGITLATDAYGPVADNAGGNAEMTHQPKEVRQRTDALDSLGNTTAATGKGFAIGSAALTALALIAAYRDQILIMGGNVNPSMMNPKTLIGLLIGGMLPFVFCSLTMSAVGRAAGAIVVEVRRQFKEIAGIMEGRTKPDYARCVNIVTRSAQKEMILPSVLAIAAPIVVGIVVGVDSVIGMLVGATVTGFVLAIMMANSGGSWDN